MTDFVYLDLDDVLAQAALMFGEPVPVRDMGMLGAAVERPQVSAFGEDAYPAIWSKAAALCDSMCNSHALVDGNKRLAWVATMAFLELNDVDISAPSNDAIYEHVMGVATQQWPVELHAAFLRTLLGPTP